MLDCDLWNLDGTISVFGSVARQVKSYAKVNRERRIKLSVTRFM